MSYTPLVRKWSGQLMKNLLPTLLVVLCSYSSLYFPVISLDARGHLALLRFFQDVLVLHNHAIMFPSILNVFLLNDGIRRNIPKLGYPTLLDIWIFGCFLAIFLIRFLYSFIIPTNNALVLFFLRLIRTGQWLKFVAHMQS